MDAWWRRSGFGSFVLFVGTVLIYWAVDGKTPTSQEWVQALVLLLGLFGYQVARPTVAASQAEDLKARIVVLEARVRAHEGQQP